MSASPPATFYFDLGSPFAYLAAERLDDVLPGPVAWQPVSLGALFKHNGRSSWAVGELEPRRTGMAEVERRAAAYGLPPVRWPDPWPGNYLTAMRAATFAYREGRGREYTECAYRSAFQEGHDLSDVEHVLRAAADAGLDPGRTAEATQDPEVKLALRAATDAAHARGVYGVPTVVVADAVYWGEDQLADAAAHLAQAAAG